MKETNEYISVPIGTRVVKRAFDIISSGAALILLFPLFIILSVCICIDSPGSPFFTQKRVGRYGRIFNIYKFRSMVSGKSANSPSITQKDDNRITKVGAFIRKYKIDEIPQLINVFIGDMSIVGPRPEVPKYVAMYNEEQRRVLSVRPGLTDLASISFIDEEQILAVSDDMEKTYVEEIMPKKLQLGIQYINNLTFFNDIKLIFRTFASILKK